MDSSYWLYLYLLFFNNTVTSFDWRLLLFWMTAGISSYFGDWLIFMQCSWYFELLKQCYYLTNLHFVCFMYIEHWICLCSLILIAQAVFWIFGVISTQIWLIIQCFQMLENYNLSLIFRILPFTPIIYSNSWAIMKYTYMMNTNIWMCACTINALLFITQEPTIIYICAMIQHCFHWHQ